MVQVGVGCCSNAQLTQGHHCQSCHALVLLLHPHILLTIVFCILITVHVNQSLVVCYALHMQAGFAGHQCPPIQSGMVSTGVLWALVGSCGIAPVVSGSLNGFLIVLMDLLLSTPIRLSWSPGYLKLLEEC